MELRLELVMIPVSDVDRAKAFYEGAGWNVDVDVVLGESMRFVQLTPPGSGCSIAFGVGITDAEPGSYRRTHLVTRDVEAARAELAERGVEISEVRHMVDGEWHPGAHPQHNEYESFAEFADPDGNTWVLQERGWSPA
ncbi:MAG TPA: VOC family protein [Actinomycetota bacterium]|nr:VOC family protein [Actinomycetota bacterium]